MENEKFYEMLKDKLGDIRWMLGLLAFMILMGNCGRSFDKSDEKLGHIASELQKTNQYLEGSRNALNRIAGRDGSCICPGN